MKHSVVIGGAGFIGSWLVDEILKDPSARVTIVDNLISSEKCNVSSDPRVTFIEGSAGEISTLNKIEANVDFIYQFACFHGNQNSINSPIADLENGMKTTLVVLEWMRLKYKNARFIYASAGCALATKTWDFPHPTLEIETTSLSHDTPYAISKITGEMYCNLYKNVYGIDVIRLRFQNVFGPREMLGAGIWRGTVETIWRNVTPTLIWKCLNNLPIEVTARASRDFIYVEDLVHSVAQLSFTGKSGEVFNLGSGKETFIIDLAQAILKLTKSKSTINVIEPRYWDNSGRRVANIQKSLDNKVLYNLTELSAGLAKTISWTEKNRITIEKNIYKHEKFL
jgi:UDP-glucose 4-epimerase